MPPVDMPIPLRIEIIIPTVKSTIINTSDCFLIVPYIYFLDELFIIQNQKNPIFNGEAQK